MEQSDQKSLAEKLNEMGIQILSIPEKENSQNSTINFSEISKMSDAETYESLLERLEIEKKKLFQDEYKCPLCLNMIPDGYDGFIQHIFS